MGCTFYTIPLFLFLFHLCFYHIWLKFKNLSTYEHIVQIREKKKAQEQLKKTSNTKAKTDKINERFNQLYNSVPSSESSEVILNTMESKSLRRSNLKYSQQDSRVYLIGPIIKNTNPSSYLNTEEAEHNSERRQSKAK